MKKITLFILTIFTVATLFAAARPSLDGRAVVADSGTMPRGLFARTVGYLPGDSVTVTNPATGSTVDVLILGAIDPSEGVAILLSPEAAEGLRIKPESNVQVKLTKRSGSLDENANGSAVLSEGDDEPASEIAESAEPAAEKNPVVTARPSVTSEDRAPAPVPVPVALAPEIEEEEKSEVVEEIPVIAEKPSYSYEPYEEIPVVAETEEEKALIEELPAIAENTIPSREPVPEEPVAEEPVFAKVEPIADASEPSEEEEIQPETVYEILPPLPDGKSKKQRVVVIEGEEPDYIETEEIEETPVIAEEELASPIKTEVAETVTEEAVALEEIPGYTTENRDADSEAVAYEDLPIEFEEEPSVIAETAAAEDEGVYERVRIAETPSDAYQPIVLVPAEPNPPVAEVAEKELAVEEPSAEASPVIEAAPVIAESAPVPAVVASESVIEPTPVVEEEPKMAVSNDWTNYVVPSVKNLRSGSYYVQVASLGNKDNIKSFVDKYSTKYPVVLVQTSSKNAYQVMVGPLNIDEYGAVGEKFKDYGFKDSFVRKIK